MKKKLRIFLAYIYAILPPLFDGNVIDNEKTYNIPIVYMNSKKVAKVKCKKTEDTFLSPPFIKCLSGEPRSPWYLFRSIPFR